MGIFNKKKANEKNNGKRNSGAYEITSADGKHEILAYKVSKQGEVTHRDGAITNLIMGRIVKHKVEDVIIFDLSDYISFELPNGIEVSNEVMEMAMAQYDSQANETEKSYYLGRLMQGQQGYYFGNKSQTVEQMVQGIVKKSEEEVERRYRESAIERETREEKFRNQIYESANKYAEEMNRTREERKANPNLERLEDYHIDGRKYYNYDGVNMLTGEILRLRKVDKVGKDGSGTYLYSAYVNSTENESDVELLGQNGEPFGEAVCFEISKRLEDIAESGDLDEIRNILMLLSSKESNRAGKELRYVGKLDKDGQIIRNSTSDSNSIRLRIEAMQKEYSRRMENKENAQDENQL